MILIDRGGGVSHLKADAGTREPESQAASANLFSGSFPINRRRRKPHLKQFAGSEFNRQSGSRTSARSARIILQQRVVCSADGKSRQPNRNVAVVDCARASQLCPLIKLIRVRKVNCLQQSSAEGKASIRLAIDGGDPNPQANASL
jgi:hypothetical protein